MTWTYTDSKDSIVTYLILIYEKTWEKLDPLLQIYG